MKMKLTFLGTGAGMPSKQRNVSSIALLTPQQMNEIWLFDCGEATQHQILQTTLKPRKITKIFITHLHGDHIFGLPGLLSSRSFLDGTKPLTIYGPKGIQKFVETSLTVSQTHLTYPINFVEVQKGQVFSNEYLSVYSEELTHGITSYGYKIIEKDRPGRLLVERLRAKGIEPGPIYQQIKENEVTITEEGKKLFRKDFVGPTQRGRKICILGDTKAAHQAIDFVKNADLLVHEATFSHIHRDLAEQYNHTTAKEAALLAKEAEVKQLILTHISSRYQQEEMIFLKREAADIFPKVLIAHDFFTYDL